MRIAVDVMGSDNFPVPDIEGAILAAREYGEMLVLVGDESVIKAELSKHDIAGLPLEIVHAAEVVTMTDKPSVVGKAKPNSSIHVGTRLVKDGQADAFVSVGNTGAILAISMLQTLKRIPGVKRPALSGVINVDGKLVTMIDVGANPDSRPEWMLQYAIMGDIYSRRVIGTSNPTIGLLSNGEEEGKGNSQIHETAELLRHTKLNFVGNVEPKEVLEGAVDVMVADGFVGNIFIKSLEGFGSYLFKSVRREVSADIPSKLGGLLARPALRRVYKRVDPFEIGGAPLLGVNGVVIIGHGRTNALGMKNAIRQAKQAVQGKIIDAIQSSFQSEAAIEE